MTNNSNYNWHTAFSGADRDGIQDLEGYDSLEEAFLAAMNFENWGPGERKIIINFP